MTRQFYVIENELESMIYIIDSNQININNFKCDINTVKIQLNLNGVFNSRIEAHEHIINCYTNERLKTVFEKYAYSFKFSISGK